MTERGIAGPLVAAQNYTAILRPLQWLVLVLVFLFFLRVIRAVWVEVRPAGARLARSERRRADGQNGQNGQGARANAPSGPKRKKKPLYLEVVQPQDHAGTIFQPDGELTIGRSLGCGIPTSYDVYSSSLHARLYRRGDQLWVEDLGSTNGTFVNSERINRAVRLGRGDLLQAGATVFEVHR